MLLTLLTFAFAAEPAPGRAMPIQLDVHVSGLILPTSEYRLLNEGGTTAVGLRAGYAVTPWLIPFVGASFNGAGMDHYFENDEAYVDDYASTFRTAYHEDQFFGGAKVQWSANRYFGLYGLVQGQAVYGLLQIDDDLDTDENPGQLQVDGVTGGFAGALGVEAGAPVADDLLAITFFLEGGYAWNAPLLLGDVATLNPQGVMLRGGLGVKF